MKVKFEEPVAEEAVQATLWGRLTNKNRRALIRDHKAREEQKRRVLAGEIPAGKPKKEPAPSKVTLVEMPVTSMAGSGSAAARMEIYAAVLKDMDLRVKEMKERKEFGDDRMAPTKWRNAKLKWWRAILALDEKGLPR